MRLTSLCKIRCEVEKTKLNEIARVKPDLKRKKQSQSPYLLVACTRKQYFSQKILIKLQWIFLFEQRIVLFQRYFRLVISILPRGQISLLFKIKKI